jgi:hypothetical protein
MDTSITFGNGLFVASDKYKLDDLERHLLKGFSYYAGRNSIPTVGTVYFKLINKLTIAFNSNTRCIYTDENGIFLDMRKYFAAENQISIWFWAFGIDSVFFSYEKFYIFVVSL